MKKNIIFFILLLLSFSTIFASEVSDLLDKAKIEYNKGNIPESINYIDSARKVLDKENLNKSADEYIEVTNWDIVKLKKAAYIGKKVKISTEYDGIFSSERISLRQLGLSFFDTNLTDQILSLKKHSKYTFYGIVQDRPSYPEFFVEKID